ncbi:hypothetical protein AYADHXPP_CDS0024 [Escherichia phage 235Ecol030PP]
MFIFNWFKSFFTDFFSTTPGEGVVPISNDYLPLTVVEYVYMGDGTVEAVTMTYEEAQEYYKNPWRWSVPTTSSNTQSSSDSYDTNVYASDDTMEEIIRQPEKAGNVGAGALPLNSKKLKEHLDSRRSESYIDTAPIITATAVSSWTGDSCGSSCDSGCSSTSCD